MAWDKDINKDLKHHLKEERARGKTKGNVPDQEKIENRRKIENNVENLLKIGNRKVFIAMLIDDYGLQEGSEELHQAIHAWNEYHSS